MLIRPVLAGRARHQPKETPTMTRTYIADEPEVATRKVYVDFEGAAHDSRDAALHANVRADIRLTYRNIRRGRVGPEPELDTFFDILENYPDMIRAYLGDIDAT